MYESLHVAVKMHINYSLFYIYAIIIELWVDSRAIVVESQ